MPETDKPETLASHEKHDEGYTNEKELRYHFQKTNLLKNTHAMTAWAYKCFFFVTFPIPILSNWVEFPPPVAFTGKRIGQVRAHPKTQIKITVRRKRRYKYVSREP